MSAKVSYGRDDLNVMKCEKPHTEMIIGDKLQEEGTKFNDVEVPIPWTGDIEVRILNKYCKNPTGYTNLALNFPWLQRCNYFVF